MRIEVNDRRWCENCDQIPSIADDQTSTTHHNGTDRTASERTQTETDDFHVHYQGQFPLLREIWRLTCRSPIRFLVQALRFRS